MLSAVTVFMPHVPIRRFPMLPIQTTSFAHEQVLVKLFKVVSSDEIFSARTYRASYFSVLNYQAKDFQQHFKPEYPIR